MFPDLKADVRADKADYPRLSLNTAVNPQFLFGVDTDSFGRNYILYTLPNETRDRICISQNSPVV